MAELYGISGTTSSGKTTLIKHLQARGYPVAHESATTIIEEGYHPANDFHDFERRVLDLSIERTLAVQDLEGPAFLDRPIADIIAYYGLAGEPVPPTVIEAAEKYMPRRVLFLSALPLEDNGIRYEDEEGQRRLDKELRRVYDWLGADVVEIPAPWRGSVDASVEARAELVLSNILPDTGEEIEQLYRASHEDVRTRLSHYAVRSTDETEERTQLYDFNGRLARRGERLRVRWGDGVELTYKTAMDGRDVKRRKEVTLVRGPLARFAALVLPKDVAYLNHTQTYRPVGDDGCNICLDRVAGLGEFVEVEARSEHQLLLWRERLGLSEPISHGYAEMVRKARA